MIITNVRCDWLFVLEASRNGKFSACAMMAKNDPQIEVVEAEIQKQIQIGIKKNKFTSGNVKSASFLRCLRDGDQAIEEDEKPEHYAGMKFFNANNKDQPGIVGIDGKPIMDTSTVYSGGIFHLDVDFYPFCHPEGGKGVAAGLNNVMFVKEGERLDGRQSAKDVFAGLEVEDDLQ